MANFKKGVALVLAAATAFTFAPVSTLGTPVVAEAAVTTKTDIKAGSTTGTSIDTADIKSGASNSFTVTGGSIYANWNANDKDEVTLSNDKVVVARNAQDVVVGVGTTTQINPTGGNPDLVNDANHTYTLNSTNASYTLSATVNKLKNGETIAATGCSHLKYTVSSSDTNVVYFGSENAKKDSATADLSGTSLSQSINTGIAGDAKVTVSVTGEIVGGVFDGQKVTLASQDVYFTVAKADRGNIETIYLKDGNGDLVKQNPAADDPYDLVTNHMTDNPRVSYSMSTVLGSLKTATIVTTTAESAALTYASKDTSVATVDAQGVITAVGKGTTDITVTASSSASYTAESRTIKVTVGTTVVKDRISVKDDKGAYIVKNNVLQKAIDMDPSTSTAATAVKTFQPVVTSDVQGTLTYAITDVNGNALSGNAALSASVDKATGLITAGDHTGKVYLQITSTSKSVTTNNGVTVVRVPVVINEKPQDTLTVNPTVINLDLAVNKTATFTAAGTTADTNVNRYSAEKYATADHVPNIAGENYDAVVLTESPDGTFTVTAKQTGTITIQVKEAAIKDKTRDTYAYVVVNVTKDAAKTASTLAVKNSAIVLEAGKTAEIGATADTAITYTVADTSIATVDNATGVVTAVAAGNTYVTVTAATTDKVEGKTITVPVVVAAPAPVVVKPAKVTGVKIANVKGAKVKVSFKKVSKAAGYVVTYKIGKKTYKKTTASTSVKLSVKKGATVKVSVKAFNYKNGNVKQYGAASKTVSKKTDKK